MNHLKKLVNRFYNWSFNRMLDCGLRRIQDVGVWSMKITWDSKARPSAALFGLLRRNFGKHLMLNRETIQRFCNEIYLQRERQK